MASGIIDQLYEFSTSCRLNADAQETLANLPREAQHIVMAQFKSVDQEQNGRFIVFAKNVLKRLMSDSSQISNVMGCGVGAGCKREAPAEWNAGVHHKAAKHEVDSWNGYGNFGNILENAGATNQGFQTFGDQHVQNFVNKWSLNQDSVDRIYRMSPAALEIVMNEFQPKNLPDGSDVNGKFIVFATKVQKTAKGSNWNGCGDLTVQNNQAIWGNAATAAVKTWQNLSGQNLWQGSCALGTKGKAMQTEAADATAEVQNFVNKWNLNQDAVDRIYRLSPAALHIVMNEFMPKGEGDDHNGKFISFAAKVERGQREGIPSAHSQAYVDPVTAFVQAWNLNEDAFAKLSRTPLAIRDIVMQQFSAPSGKSSKEVSALLIGFANSVQKKHAGKAEF